MLLLVVLLLYVLLEKKESFSESAFGDVSDRYTCSTNKEFNNIYFEIENFLTEQECDNLIQLAILKGVSTSEVNMSEGSQVDENVRISETTWFEHDSNDAVAEIKSKVVNVLEKMSGCFPSPSKLDFEPLQIVHYKKGGKYDPHYDGDECTVDQCKLKLQRIATFLIYLNDDFQGGHTAFPVSNVSITPKKGKLLFFWVADPKTSQIYKETLHGGKVIESGEKWIATQWIRV